MTGLIPLRRPGAGVGDRHEVHADFGVEPFDLYGRHHEVIEAHADVGVTRLSEGLHLDHYAERALPNEVPMQVFSPGTEPVEPESGGDEIDPRWRVLGGLFASSS